MDCDILIIGNPFGDQEAFAAAEVEDITRFVEEGGKVIIAIGRGVTRDGGFIKLLKNFGVIDYKGFLINERLKITWQSTHPLLRNVGELGASGGYTVEPNVEVIVNRVRKDTTKYKQNISESVKLVKTYEIITPVLVCSKLGKGVFVGTGEINFTKPYLQFLKNLFQYLINFDKIKETENEQHFFCPMCGILLPSSARFCPQCGTALDRIRR
nr:zinc ribbon domain-containing protein [Candidatus Freyarchaeota archaeon]